MSELHFDSQSSQNNPDVSAVSQHQNILSVNPYEFMEHTYYGTGGYRNGTYLINHQRESYYDSRREYSSYRNFMRPIIRSLIEPVFTEKAKRVVLDANQNDMSGTLFSGFIDDCDNNGTSLQEFTEDVLTNARLLGCTFVVMDNFPDHSPDKQTALDNRIYPYLYQVKPQGVKDYSVDKFGKITSITLEDDPLITKHGFSITKEDRYRLWTDTYSVLLKKDNSGTYTEVEARVEHGLGVIPVIPVYIGKKKSQSDILVDPPMYDLGRLNCSLYNKDSEIRDLERSQAFAIFFLQTEEGGNVTLGSHNALFLPMETTIPPGFASPDPSIMTTLADSCEKLRESIFMIAEQNGVQGVRSAKSGIAIQWDFFAVESQLKKTSKVATDFELALSNLFKLYTNEEFEYIVEYPSDFQPGNQGEVLDTYKKVFDLNPPEELKRVLWEKTTRMLMSDESEEDVQVVVSAIYAETTDDTIVTDEETKATEELTNMEDTGKEDQTLTSI